VSARRSSPDIDDAPDRGPRLRKEDNVNKGPALLSSRTLAFGHGDPLDVPRGKLIFDPV